MIGALLTLNGKLVGFVYLIYVFFCLVGCLFIAYLLRVDLGLLCCLRCFGGWCGID